MWQKSVTFWRVKSGNSSVTKRSNLYRAPLSNLVMFWKSLKVKVKSWTERQSVFSYLALGRIGTHLKPRKSPVALVLLYSLKAIRLDEHLLVLGATTSSGEDLFFLFLVLSPFCLLSFFWFSPSCSSSSFAYTCFRRCHFLFAALASTPFHFSTVSGTTMRNQRASPPFC